MGYWLPSVYFETVFAAFVFRRTVKSAEISSTAAIDAAYCCGGVVGWGTAAGAAVGAAAAGVASGVAAAGAAAGATGASGAFQ